MVEEVSAGSWQEKVVEADKPVLVDFFAIWCGPCKALDPVVEEIAAERAGQALVYKFDIDEDQDLPRRYGVVSIPTLVLFENGEVAGRLVGSKSKDEIVALLG